jgi:hypothetical protein
MDSKNLRPIILPVLLVKIIFYISDVIFLLYQKEGNFFKPFIIDKKNECHIMRLPA